MYGLYGEDSSKRVDGSRLTPAGLFDEVATTRLTPAADAAASRWRVPSVLIS